MGGEASTLGDVASIQTGPFGSQLHASDYKPVGIPVVMPTNIVGRRIDPSAIMRVAQEEADRLSRHKLRAGDLVFSRRGEIDKCALTAKENVGWLCGTGCLLARVDRRKAEPAYVAFHVNEQSTREWLRSNAVGLVMPNLNTGILERLPLRLPPLPEQQSIVELLGALDDKIELNRQIAETLEATAQALFKSWFVDFDPVRAKAEGRPTGLSDALAALFPDRLTDECLPEGWANTSLSSIGRFLNGLALQKFEAEAGEPSLPVIKIAELRSGPTAKSGRARASLPADYVVNDGDHLFSWSGSLTHVRWSHGPGALNQHLFKVTPLGVPAWLTFQAVEEHLLEFQAIASGKAVTMGHIQRHHLDEAKVAMPDERLLLALDQVMAPLYERTLGVAIQSRSLAVLRDTLLPKLISGALRIRDAEREVVAA